MRALQGADIGHLVHGPFPAGRAQRLYELNSSLSNYRLFQYMAAGLPILSYEDPRMAQLYEDVRCFRVARLTHLVEDIGAGVRELGRVPATRRELGRAARRAFVTHFNWEHQFAPVLQMLNAGQAPGPAMSALRS
jgi:glycosyltransferase involved in cell wall biosynthesis